MVPGFTPYKPTRRLRLVMNVEGLEGSGKTFFANTAPGPVAYMPTERGWEGVLENFEPLPLMPSNGNGEASPYIMPAELDLDVNAAADKARPIWQRWRKDYLALLRAPKVRTIVVDTASGLWEIRRLAAFGKLTEVPPILYTQVNVEFSRLITMGVDSDKNVIWISRIKPKWEEGGKVSAKGNKIAEKTDKLERVGYKDLGFEVQVSLRLSRESEGKFERSGQVVKCRLNDPLVGKVLKGGDLSFSKLASLVFNTSEDEWL